MKDVTDSSTNIETDMISDQMEYENEKSKASNIDQKTDIKSMMEHINTPETITETSRNIEVKSENDREISIKVEVDVKDEKNEPEMLLKCDNLNIDHNEMDIATKIEDTKDSKLTNSIENETGSNNAVMASDEAVKSNSDTTEMNTKKQESAAINANEKSEDQINSFQVTKSIFKRKRTHGRRSRPSKKAKIVKENVAATSTSSPIESFENICSPEAESRDEVEFCLNVTNLPNSWSFMDIKNYIDVQCGPVDEIEMFKDDNTGNGAIRLSYQTEEDCKKAMEKLMDKEIEGTKLDVSMIVVCLDIEDEVEVQPNAPEPPTVSKAKPMESQESQIINEQSRRRRVSYLQLEILREYLKFNPRLLGGRNKTVESREYSRKMWTKLAQTLNALGDGETERRKTGGDGPKKPWRPDLDFWEIDPKGVYGLKESFLKTLDITPPLDKWVHVSNFRCDKAELRDVLELAGRVLLCTVFASAPKYANVMYSHPLEAVQAVSMLHGQTFYGQTLKVVMDKSPADTVLLPKGLNSIGPGLGPNGKPLRTVVKHYQRLVNNQTASVNVKAFDIPENLEGPNGNSEVDDKSFTIKNVEEFNYALPPTASKTNASTNPVVTPPRINSPVVSRPVVTQKTTVKPQTSVKTPVQNQFVRAVSSPPARQNFPTQNYQQRNFGPNFGQFGPRPGWSGPGMDPRMVRPFGPGPRPAWNGPGWSGPGPMGPMGQMGAMPGPMPGPMPGAMQGPMPGPMMGPRPMGPGYHAGNEPVQLQFSNLPPSTTFAILCEKMAACGQVVSIQLTTPGCAVVTFANRIQADVCFQTYNNVCVEGCVIQVKYT